MDKIGANKISAFAKSLISLPRPVKQLIMVAADTVVLPLCLWAAIALKQGTLAVNTSIWGTAFFGALAAAVVTFWFLGLYRSVIRYLGPQAMGSILIGVTVSAAAAALTARLPATQVLPISVLVIYW